MTSEPNISSVTVRSRLHRGLASPWVAEALTICSMRLWDSGDRQQTSTVGHWLSSALTGATGFRVQTGYYSDGALFHVEDALRSLLDNGGTFRLVLGGNQRAARIGDVETLLDFMAPYPNAEAVVLFPGASRLLVHSKTYHVSHPQGDSAWVGSSNFTAFGIGNNVEAGVALSGSVEAAVVQEVADRTDALFGSSHPFQSSIVPLTGQVLPVLSAYGVLTRKEIEGNASRSSRTRSTGTVPIPSLPFLNPPRRPGSRPPRGRSGPSTGAPQPPPPPVSAGGGMAGTPHPGLPPGVVASVKVLGKTDVKGIKEQAGTWYLSFGLPYQNFFSQQVGKVPVDPRIETVVEARLATQPVDTVTTAPDDTTSITLEGAAAKTKTNLNTRVNLSKHLASEFRAMAARLTESLPKPGDLVIAEYLDGTPVVVRLSFVRQGDPNFKQLKALIGQGRRTGFPGMPPHGYGWLRAPDVAALLPPW